jgi:hypothetical protein
MPNPRLSASLVAKGPAAPELNPQEEPRWHRDGPDVSYVRTITGSVTVRAQISWPADVVTQLGSVGRASHETQAKGCG